MTEPLSRAQRVRQLFEEHNYVLASVSNVLEVMRIVESEETAALRAQLAQQYAMNDELTALLAPYSQAGPLVERVKLVVQQLAQRTAELDNLRALKDYERVNLEAANELLDERLQQLTALQADHQRVTLDWQQEKERTLELEQQRAQVMADEKTVGSYAWYRKECHRMHITINEFCVFEESLKQQLSQAQATIAEQRAILEERRKG